jgi:hypothetical protein
MQWQMIVLASWESVYKISQLGGRIDFYIILLESLSGLMRFMTADQKQQYVNVCEELHQIAFDNAIWVS